jgi:D-amino-acid dehydrogenase
LSRRVLIVGGGVIGLSTAFYAVRKGLHVTLLERGGPEESGCSFGNAGMIVPSHLVPLAAPGMVARGLRHMWSRQSAFYVKPRLDTGLLDWGLRFWRAASEVLVARAAPLLRELSLRSRACYEEWASEWDDDFGLVKRGLLMLCRTAQGLEEEAALAEHARALAVPARVLTPQQTSALEPDLTMRICGAIHYPMDCHLTPALLMAALRRRVEQAGVRIGWETSVRGFRRSGDRIAAVETRSGEIAADDFVLCAGAWSPLLVRGLGMRLPLQAGKGYSLTLPSPPQLPRTCAILSEAHVAVTPMGSALRVGGTLELGGIDLSIDPARVGGIVRAVGEYLPAFTPERFGDVPAWCGLRPCSPDGLPYLGRFARFANLWAATGHAMLGVSLGPVSGWLMAELLAGEQPPIPLGALSPDRHG